jgi:hypothetical protein
MNDRLTIAAMLLAGQRSREWVGVGDVPTSLELADALIAADKATSTVAVGDTHFDESQAVAVQVLPTVCYDDFVFEAGDRCECTDGETRTAFCCDGYTTASVGGWLAFRGVYNDRHFDGATVYRNDKPVAVLTTDPAAKKPFAFRIGDVVIIPDVCGRIITNVEPLRWTGGGRLDSSELDDQCKEFARQLRKGAVWRGGELIREAVA